MRLRAILFLILALSTFAEAKDKFVSIDGYVVAIHGSRLRPVAHYVTSGLSLRNGTSNPVISPNGKLLAIVRDHSAFIAPLSSAGVGKEKLIFAGKDGGPALLSIESFLVGFTPDSKSIYYTVAPGQDPCPDCPRHHVKAQPADYGFFRYDVASGDSRKISLHESSRLHPRTEADRLFITDVGPYGDQFGIFDLRNNKFSALPKVCAAALDCSITANEKTATCTQVLNSRSQVIECDLATGTTTELTPLGSCPNDSQQALRSPAGTHVAYVHSEDRCRGKLSSLVVDKKSIFRCEGLSSYVWVDEKQLLVHYGAELRLITTEGKNQSSMPAPQTTQAPD
jgi:hypothetical protein